ncbi:hypothetical protein D1007_42937 [Hordeum vulgare]|nr:hypothetical protein D1007_42937 [Hordeum vulgare]
MERLRSDDEEELPIYCDDDKECFPGEKECLLRLTTFHVVRKHDGEPVATALRPARSYKVPRYNTRFDAYKVSRYNPKFEAKAFWM